MRFVSRRRAAMGAMALIGTLALTGCAPQPTPSPPPATATDAPIFASDAEALTAATDAFAAYDSMTAAIGAEGGLRPERIEPFATANYYPDLIVGFQNFAASGVASVGIPTFDTVSLVRYSDDNPGHATVEVYLCSDVTNIRLLDGAGTDVTPLDRPNRLPLQVVLVSGREAPKRLLIDKETVWSGKNFCLV